jgi:hypothetical protein
MLRNSAKLVSAAWHGGCLGVQVGLEFGHELGDLGFGPGDEAAACGTWRGGGGGGRRGGIVAGRVAGF